MSSLSENVNCQKDTQIIVFVQLAQRFYHTNGLILLKLCQSVSSPSVYQHVGSSEKISMGEAIGEHLNNKQTTKNNTCNYSSVNTEFKMIYFLMRWILLLGFYFLMRWILLLVEMDFTS